MKLYYSPGACSLGIHVLLNEIGKPFEGAPTLLAKHEQYTPAFVAKNPKSKVPTLERDDGSVLTEFPAIAVWLARANPEKNLLPKDADGEARALEAMDYAVSTIHMQGFSRFVRPGNFAPSEADHEAVKARGVELMEKGFAVLDKALAGREYIAGSFSVADAALFYVEFWYKVRVGKDLPPNIAAHFQRMLARPAVQKAMETEGLKAA
jgi:glutathione S-transferase